MAVAPWLNYQNADPTAGPTDVPPWQKYAAVPQPPTQPPTARAPAAVPVQSRQQLIQQTAAQAIADRHARIASVGGDIASKTANYTDAFLSGINSMSFGLPNFMAAAARTYVPGLRNGGSYRDNKDVADEISRQEASRAPLTSAAANIAGSIETGKAALPLIRAGAGAAMASGSRIAQAGGKALNFLSTMNKGDTAKNLLVKAPVIGAAVGAGQAAGTGDDVKRGAVYGAVGGAAGHVLAKGAGLVGEAIADRINPNTPVIGKFATNATGLLQRYVNTSPEQIQQTAAASEAATGVHPTLAEVLPADDRGRLADAMRRMPVAQREALNNALGARAGEMGQQLATRTQAIVGPGQQDRVDSLAQQLADSRARGAPGTGTPTQAERDLAISAASDPERMQAVRSQVSSNIMAPHDNTQIFENTDQLHPTQINQVPGASTQVPTGVLDGAGNPVMRTQTGPANFVEERSQPDVSNLIDSVTPQALRVSPQGVRGSDISKMVSRLRDIAGSTDPRADFAAQAADHLENIIPPEMQADLATMRAAHAGNSRLLEGMQAGGKTALRSDMAANIGTDIKAGRKIRNAFDSGEGNTGRALGQTNRLMSDFSGTPQQVGNAAGDIATNPSTQAAIAQNLGAPQAGQIAEAAAAQTRGARNLSGFSTDPTSANKMSLGDMMHNLMGLAPGSLPHTKANVIIRFLDALKGAMPPEASQQIIDGLFSQNPANISRGLGLLDRAGEPGQAALRALQAGVSGGAAGSFVNQQTTQPVGDAMPQTTDALSNQPGAAIGQAPLAVADVPMDANNLQPGDATSQVAPDAMLGQGPGADPSRSPYAPVMQQYYDSQEPDMQGFIDRIQQQESGGQQHDKDGSPLTSSAGAIGIMQIMPETGKGIAAQLGVPWDETAFAHDPSYNKLIGTAYLGQLLGQFNGDVAEAAAAYNAGPGAVIKALKSGGNWLSHLPQETQNYVRNVASD